MFKLIGVLVGLYAVYAAAVGRVYAKAGAGGEKIYREASPEYFWVVVAIYACLSAALLVYF